MSEADHGAPGLEHKEILKVFKETSLAFVCSVGRQRREGSFGTVIKLQGVEGCSVVRFLVEFDNLKQ